MGRRRRWKHRNRYHRSARSGYLAHLRAVATLRSAGTSNSDPWHRRWSSRCTLDPRLATFSDRDHALAFSTFLPFMSDIIPTNQLRHGRTPSLFSVAVSSRDQESAERPGLLVSISPHDPDDGAPFFGVMTRPIAQVESAPSRLT